MKVSGPALKGKAALAAGFCILVAFLAYGLRGSKAAAVIPTGTVMVGTGNGLYSEFTQSGTLITQLNTMSSSTEETGCGFDPLTGDFYNTNFEANNVSKFDPTGAFITIFGSGYNMHPESIAFDGANPESVYVGQADGTHEILKFDTSGNSTGTFTPTTDQRGTDWIDLASDRCTMFYCSEGKDVERFNVCTNTQLTNFNTATLPGTNAFAHRILLPGQFGAGGVLVADSQFIVRLDATGADVQHYTIPDTADLFALNLDPDGKSFWTGDIVSGFVTKVDIQSGTILQHWNANTAPNFVDVAGVCIKGELINVPTPTPTGKATPTPTVTGPTQTASPIRPTSTPRPTPVAASAVISAPAPPAVSGTAGQTIAGGTFTLANTSSTLSETFTSVTIGLSQPTLFSALKLTASFGGSTATGTSSSPQTSTVVTMTPPIVLAAGAKANFTLSATLSSTTLSSTGRSGGGITYAAFGAPRSIGSGGARGLAAGLALLMFGLVSGPGWRKRRLLAVIGLLVLVAASQTACDPCGSCPVQVIATPIATPTPLPISSVAVTAATGKNQLGGGVVIAGIPVKLSTVTRN